MLFQHGIPAAYDRPLLSDRVLVWNERAIRWYKMFAPAGSRPTFEIVGNPELDEIRTRTPSGPGACQVVFLSQCDTADEWWADDSASESILWLLHVARACPEIVFQVKRRRFNDLLPHYLSNESRPVNVELVPPQVTLTEMLARPEVGGAIAYSSSGLLVAAGMGKLAIRLCVAHQGSTVPLVDEIAHLAHSPEELARLLRLWLNRGPFPVSDTIFPHLGNSAARMIEICESALGSERVLERERATAPKSHRREEPGVLAEDRERPGA